MTNIETRNRLICILSQTNPFSKSVGFESKFVACENPVIVHNYKSYMDPTLVCIYEQLGVISVI